MDREIDRNQVYRARVRVRTALDEHEAIMLNLDAYTVAQGGGSVALVMSPLDAEMLAESLLMAAIAYRQSDAKD